MEKYSINGVSLIKNEKAIFPMMGEFHFSRCPEKEWEDEIRKMRACGMDIIATYVFWIHHEEEEGVFDFSGQRNLHRFLEKVAGTPNFSNILRIVIFKLETVTKL